VAARPVAGRSAHAASDGLFWPLGVRGKSGGGPSDHGARAFGNWQSDNAWDILAPKGTKVYAVSSGTITRLSGSTGNESGNPAGLSVTLTGGGNAWWYGHLSRRYVKEGQRVRAGQLIGESGIANSVPHLHIGQQHGDPIKTLTGKALPVAQNAQTLSDDSPIGAVTGAVADAGGDVLGGLFDSLTGEGLRMLLYLALVLGAAGLVLFGGFRVAGAKPGVSA
jgi:murein DD-endopeptidase MepM/ murein hydrolase activator NlpD